MEDQVLGKNERPDALSGLSAERRALLAMRLARKAAAAPRPEAIRPRAGGGPAPLSFTQQRLWFLDQLEPGLSIYNIPMPMRVSGPLRTHALERALNEILRRHEVLRTTFSAAGDEPVQVVSPFEPLVLPVTDLSALPDEERAAAARRIVSEQAREPFDLESGPPVRVSLLRLGEEEHVVLVVIHHIVFDGWSMGVMVKEFSALYDAFLRGARRSPLPELPIQYADYAVWQREQLSGERLEKRLAYWREHLAGAPPTLELPADFVCPAQRSFKGAGEGLLLTSAPADALRSLARREGVTLFMTLLAAFQALLHRYSGQDRVVVGTPIAGRDRGEIEGLIGFFANTLVLHTDLSGDPTFRELLGRVREVSLGAYAHQDVPFEKLVEELQPDRDAGRNPLFQVTFSLQNEPGGNLSAPGLKVDSQEFDYQSARFDLECNTWEHGHDIRGLLTYSDDLFRAETVGRMARHFERLLEGVAADPDRRLSALPLLGEEERRRLLVEFNDTRAEFPEGLSLHRLFEEQAARTPEAAAVVAGGAVITYGELDARANRLARHLRSLGVGAESVVGVLLERSAEMVVALLGVLKAGGAYLPLDSTYPADRLAFMLEDSRARLLVTEEGLRGLLPGAPLVLSLDSDEGREAVAAEGAGALPPAAASENAAYVIYTSGSTGRPKGVVVPHAAICNHMLWMQRELPLVPSDAVLQKTPFGFDASVWEFYAPLLVGARLVMASPGAHLDPALLAEEAAASGVTILQLVPSLLRVLLEEEGLGRCAALRRVFCGGEALGEDLVEALHGRLDGVELYNLYGPTEATIDSTFRRCEPGAGRVGIGRPVANARAYILDRAHGPAPVGVPGELYVAGAGLSRGYLNRPALTAERFLPDPFSAEPGARMYRTGDLARYLADGDIEFLGRVDQQVKLRGFRIELGEIEASLLRREGVREAVVVVREDVPGDQRLVAYVVAGEVGLNTAELRLALRTELPEYMVPSQFVVLDALPLTPNGKVDRKALPAPEANALAREYVAPRTPAEELVALAWADLLALPRVSAFDNFFDLGGHSLLATRLVSRLRRSFGVDVPLRSLFEWPTVAGLAAEAERLVREGAGLSAPPLLPAARDGELPLSFAQQRLWFLDQLEPGLASYNIPTAVRLEGDLDVGALRRALTEMVLRHESLRTVFTESDGSPLQVILPASPVALEVTDLTSLPSGEREAEARRLAAEEAQTPFDLSTGPLLRAALIRISDSEHVFLLTMHHIVSDGWSLGVLIEEVGALYEAYVRGKESPLPELEVQYADYAAWQRGWLQGEVLDRQLSYWREQLGGAPPVLELPTDRPRPAVQSMRGATYGFILGEELTAGIKALSRSEGVTLFMTLLAGFQALLSRYTGQEDVSVGTPIAGRTRGEVERLIGFFVNTLVMRTDLSGGPTFRELLSRVREVTLGAYAHQEVPFEKLVEELQPEREMSHTPLFQVMFILQNTGSGGASKGAEVSGLRMSGMEAESNTSKFDITLAMEEGRGGLGAAIEYSTDLFDAGTIERLASHFVRLLEAAVASPDLALSELPLLDQAERRSLLLDFNDSGPSLQPAPCLHHLFRQQALRTPDATAVVCSGLTLSYRDLDDRSDRLARRLQALGAGPDSIVGLLMGRSAETVVAILGVLKSGAAYLPLDPNYPGDRLSLMLEDSGSRLLLTEERLSGLLDAAEALVLCLDSEEEREAVAAQPAGPVESGASPDNLAYIIYTSGSTGRPKGVAIAHSSAAVLARWSQSAFSPEELSRVLFSTSVCFDLSIFELFAPLCSGGAVVVAKDALELPLLGDEAGVTLVNTVPSAMAELVRQGGLPESVLTVNLAGEALKGSLAEAVYVAGAGRVCNLYGPTEDTTYSTWSEVASGGEREPVIGSPVANTRAYVVDGRLEPAPVGVAGELYLSGDGLARGYLNRPSLTAERFVPDPHATEPGSRMYKTGDVARWLSSGELEYLGRADQQVKVRGFRIELGEIEASLLRREGVREAVVVVREVSEGDQRLIAYVAGEAGLKTAELRVALRTELPEYMVPSQFVQLDALPLTPNGKVDRKALPAPQSTGEATSGQFVAPRTPAEELVALAWADLLALPRVSALDNFFDLGGHSLLATRLVSRLRRSFGVDVPLRSLFEWPTVAGLAAEAERLVREGAGLSAPPLLPAARDGELPLSFAQQRLWFLDQLEPGLASYNIPTAVRLEGDLDVGALRRALTEMVRRHESLRTVFAESDGSPLQVILPPSPVALEVVDLTGMAAEEREAEAGRLAAEEAQTPFDLSAGPLLRAGLVRVGEREHVFLLTMHHIVSDGWSLGVLIEEVGALYEAYLAGEESPLPELEVQYADYAAWQRGWLQGEVLDRQLSYWREQLSGAPPVLELPTDRPRPAVQSMRGATHSFVLGEELTAGIKALSRSEGVTLFMTLLAGFQALLSRYTGQEDVSVGTPIAGRTRGEVERLIGFFVNTLVMRTDLSGGPTFRELLGRVREVTLGAYAHQEVPFEKLVDELEVERSLSHAPLFQVMFVLQNTGSGSGGKKIAEVSGLRMSGMEAESNTSKFDLTLAVAEGREGLSASIEYSTELFEAESIERLAGHFERLLAAATADPDRRLSDLQILSPEERERVVEGFNPSRRRHTNPATLHGLFERQAALSPHAVALSFDGLHLSYSELNARANRLARRLRSLGVGPESPVALYLDRSAEMVVAILAVLKAGGAYLPLDPAYPRERVLFAIEDAGADVLITRDGLGRGLPARHLVELDADWWRLDGEAEDDLPEFASPENLAYVIYTSGSTGKPKGVQVTHANVARLFASAEPLFSFSASDVWTLFHSYAFDFSVWELWGALLYGGRLVVVPQMVARSAGAFLGLLEGEGVTVLNQTPSAFYQLMEADGEEDGARALALRYVVFGGEALGERRLGPWVGRRGVERPRLVNMYGITETTVHVTHREVTADLGEGSRVGVALDDLRAYVLEGGGSPAPVGVAGELYVAGDGLARGYLNRPSLTAERFVPDPFSAEPGARMYRSGDVARWLSSGELEYLGRADQQVKIRGFRIELGEIEAALLGHAGVAEAAVVAREEGTGDKRLVAYVVTGGEVGGAELREHLRGRLPEYMVPAQFVQLERLPLTANGKLDRKALPAPQSTGEATSGQFVAPRTPAEELVALAWADLLALPRVSALDNFFDLGGHSLLATRLVSRLRRSFGVDVPLRSLFEWPTVAGLAAEAERLVREGAGLSAPPLLPAGRDGELPLSFAQQRLWFLDQLEPGLASYNIPAAVRLEGDLDVGALRRALSEMVRRHESLRTVFAESDGSPLQVILPPSPVALEVTDLSGLDEEEREAEAGRLAAEEAQTPFDLSTGPLLRAALIRISDSEHVFLLTMHHIVSDGWSLGVLIEEVGALYEAYVRGEESPLPELEVQYADYAAWQRGWLQGEVLERQLSYWREQLSGAPPVLELPTDRPRPAVQSFRGATYEFALGEELTAGLKGLSRSEGVTLFMTLLAGFQALLSRYTGQEDVSVGTPIAGRTRGEVERLIGFFVNTLVMRTDLSGGPTFRELLGRVREVTLGAYAHQEVPFEKLVDELEVERSLSHAPLFQVMFVLQNTGSGSGGKKSAEVSGLRMSGVEAESNTSKFDLTLAVAEGREGLSASIEYSTELFEAESIERLAGHFERLLAAAAADPDSRLDSLEILAPEERRRLLSEWKGVVTDYPREATVHGLFERQAALTPDATALIFGGEALTYGQLNERADGLARRLRRLGVGPETTVGLCADRSPEMVAGLLAVLKAGGAYVPLDPQYPQERLRFMLEDAGVSVLLAQSRLAARLPAEGLRVLLLDGDADEDEAPSRGDALGVEVGAGNLAYLMYTSGSTGRPKGVAVTHRNVVRLVTETDFARFGAEEVWLQYAPISFDASTLEIWGSLLHGSRLLLARPGVAALEELGREVRAGGVTTLWLTAGLFHLMADERPEDLKGVRQLLAGGDVLSPAHVRKFVGAAAPGATLINGYGPTENTTFTCCFPVTAETQFGGTVPVGRPVANTEVFILDRSLRPVPQGVVGELMTGGDGLARGYFNRPALTAERFVPHPFAEGARLYRTGDLARYLPDGSIEFIGRADQQVKIRGFRIELGEIEAALLSREGVREAVVVAREDVEGDKRLVAYLVSDGAEQAAAGELQRHLRETLPEHMLPAAFVWLDGLPLTENGKVDRKALPAPQSTGEAASGQFVAPRTPAEELVALAWADLLALPRVSALDNFFDLGGHSLLATRLVSRLRRSFGVDVPLRSLFEWPTVAGLAAEAERLVREGAGLSAPPLLPVGRDSELPLSFAQQRLWFLDQLEPGLASYNIPAAVRLEGDLDVGALRRALTEMVRRHESLRTVFAESDGSPLQVILPASPVALEVTDLSGLDEEEREAEAGRLAAEEAQTPFDLSAGPLLRAGLVKVGEREHVFLLTMHHIVSDGWSLGVLIEEVGALYEAYVRGEESPLPELEVQYADYAAWQRGWLQGEVLDRQLSYWREQLGGAPPVLELPTDRPRPAVQSFRGATYEFTLGEELTAGLKGLSRSEGVTLFMTLLAGFQALLSRYTGQEDVSVGTPIAGRTRGEVERLIGFFVNTLVMRTDLSGDPTFVELLGRVREVALGGYAHQEVPFEKLVDELEVERSLSHAPLFQVMFVLQNTGSGKKGAEVSGLRMSGVEAENHTSKFDLTLAMTEGREGLSATIQYSTELFDAGTIERLAGHLQALYEAAAADPGRRLSKLPILGEEERRRLLVEFNDTRAEYPRGLCLHRLFEEQAGRTPDAVAVVEGSRRLTYRELDERADRLAGHLRGRGVTAESRVGLLVERSAEMVAAMLAVLKAGGAYVPLDPEYPAERLAFMLEDSGAALLITQERLREGLPPFSGEVFALDPVWDLAAGESPARPESPAAADNLAYVIYTSGSTGKPKGVAVSHAAICNHLLWRQEAYPLGAADRFLQKASFSFDISVWEIFAPLAAGARLVLAEPGGQKDTAYLARTMAEERITVAHFGPAALQALLEEPGLERCESLRHVFCGGEQLPAGLRARFSERLGASLHHQYGPTEATVDATVHDCVEGAGRPGRIPIGRPIANTTAYVLDRFARPAPAGVAGELHLGGLCLARGYLNRPALTAERFLPDPFSAEPGARMYRTGDLARWLPSGELEFLGRTDQQVKLRGFRVEPGEVEAALLGHDSVREALVVAREDVEGDRRLVAYVVGAGGGPSAAELREHLRGRLPDHMVPSAFVTLEGLPLTPNGKVDRKALPAPEDAGLPGGRDYVPPRDVLELTLAGIWEEVLRVGRVGVTDNFFEVGGHSLLAVQLMSRVERVVGVRLPLAALFQGPTVESLAGLLRRSEGARSSSSLVAVQPKGDERPFFCVHAVGGNVLSYVELARELGPERPFYALQSRGLAGGHAPHASVEEMAAHYVEEMRAVQPEGPYLLGGWSMGGVVAYEMSQQLRARGEEVALLALLDSTARAEADREGSADDLTLLEMFAEDAGLPLERLGLSREELEGLAPGEQLSRVLGRARAVRAVPPEIGAEEVGLLFEVFKANLRASRGYVPRPNTCPVTLLRASESPAGEGQDESKGWAARAAGGLEVHVVPGDHYSILREPNVKVLAGLLAACIRAADEVIMSAD